MQPLRVNVDDLRLAASQMDAIAGKLATARANPGVGSSWLASSAAVSAARSDAGTSRAALAARIKATSEKLAAASVAYADSDTHLGAKLRELGGPEAK